MNKYRTHNCSELTISEINKQVTLSGWLHRKRDHGNLLFIDLRDHYGITQCVIENKNKNFKTLEKAITKKTKLIFVENPGSRNCRTQTNKKQYQWSWMWT